ncbi:MAG TPA: hypothetical protein VE085_16875 [Burkholderiales bacterium]|nr:hypothetical protein [Burkholderiales bacterium]
MPTNVARIGRSYPSPRLQAVDAEGAPRARSQWRFTLTGGAIVLASALAFGGWWLYR